MLYTVNMNLVSNNYNYSKKDMQVPSTSRNLFHKLAKDSQDRWIANFFELFNDNDQMELLAII